MKHIPGALVLFAATLMISSVLLQNLVVQRRTELRELSLKLEQNLLQAKLQLAQVAKELSSDAVLISSIQEQHKNTYSSKIRHYLRLGAISHMGIYNKNCGHFYSANLELKEGSYCRQQEASSSFRWLQAPGGKLLVLIKKLGPEHLLSVGVHITESWVRSNFFDSSFLGVKMEAFKKDQTHMGALLTYPITHHPVVYDHHPLTRFLKGYSAPGAQKSFNILWIMITFLLSLGLWLKVQQKNHRHHTQQLQTYRQRLQKEAQSLQPIAPQHEPTLEGVLEAHQTRLAKLKQINIQRRELIEQLTDQLKRTKNRISHLGYYKAVHEEVQRNAEILRDQRKRQGLSLGDLEDLIELWHQTSHHQIHQVLTRWNEDMKTKGARKFLRSYLEISAPKLPKKSLLEADMDTMLSGVEKLQSLRVSLHQNLGHIHKQSRYFDQLMEAWARLSTLPTPTLEDTLKQVSWQIRLCGAHLPSWHRPAWQEPDFFPRPLAQVMRCVLYEVLSAFPHKATLTLHYLPYPTERLLISTPTWKQPENHKALVNCASLAADIGKVYGVRFEPQRSSTEKRLCYSLSWKVPKEERKKPTTKATLSPKPHNLPKPHTLPKPPRAKRIPL